MSETTQATAAGPPTTATATTSPPSIESRIKRLSTVETAKGICVGVHGEAGVGKTTLVTSLPAEKTIVLDVEGGLGVLTAHGWNGSVISIERNIEGLRETVDYLTTAAHPFQFVVVDSVSYLERWMIATLTQSRGKVFTELKEYGDVAVILRARLLSIIDLRKRGINVLLLAHSTADMRGSEGVAFPSINAKVSRDFLGWCDCFGHMSIAPDGKGTRTIQWDPSPTVRAKSRFACLAPVEAVDRGGYMLNVYRRIWAERSQGFAPKPAPIAEPQAPSGATVAQPSEPAPKSEASKKESK